MDDKDEEEFLLKLIGFVDTDIAKEYRQMLADEDVDERGYSPRDVALDELYDMSKRIRAFYKVTSA